MLEGAIDRANDFWAFNANSIMLTAVVAVVFVVFHEATTIVVRRIRSTASKWLRRCMLTAVVAVVFVVFHEATTIVVRRIRSTASKWLRR